MLESRHINIRPELFPFLKKLIRERKRAFKFWFVLFYIDELFFWC